ncbi:MAG TPA: 4'-phosphopantetheinyl transferase superfamily protein [Verrucomicrobiae bacterium]|nr:4'-phosphopantetheinyl transferase superfamily protein [Verrucomicrobiae bacterium]
MNASDLRFCRVSLNELREDGPLQFAWQDSPSKPVLERDEIHLWMTNLDGPSWQADALQHVLREDERLRAGKFHFDSDRNRFIVRRAVLRQIVGQYLGKIPGEIEFVQNSFGKPELAGSAGERSLQFNLSASAEWALAAFTVRQQVGVDIEKVRRNFDWNEIAGQFFHSYEVRRINELPEAERGEAFFRHWTIKEAFIKARGVGLERSLLELDFTATIRKGKGRHTDVNGGSWLCVSFCPGENLIAGLVVES